MQPTSNGIGQTTNIATPETSPSSKHSPRHWIMLIAIALVLAGVVAFGVYMLLSSNKTQSTIRTYFSYDESDIQTLRDQSSAASMSVNEVQQWEDNTYELVESNESVDVDASKVYAYLTVAQMDAAALSFEAHGAFMGSLALVSKDILCAFYSDDCNSFIANDDAYSKKLAEIVMAKVNKRMAEDLAQNKPVVLKTGSEYWQGPAPQIGISAPSFKPWFIAKADQFRSAPPLDPSSPEMEQQLAEVKESLANATNEEKAIVVKWAGGPGTRTPPGIWLTLAADYMQTNTTPLDTYLEVRALTAASMADAVIAVFDSKYAYQYMRPNMFDTSIVTIMPTPNHPSYPAGHATISWAAASVLAKYLPGNTQEWERLAKEASDSRTIGGIHFPADNTAGTTLGKNVGNEVNTKW